MIADWYFFMFLALAMALAVAVVFLMFKQGNRLRDQANDVADHPTR
jgi:hypothetical protein